MPYPARKDRTEPDERTMHVRQDDTGIIPLTIAVLLVGVFSWLYAHGIDLLAERVDFVNVTWLRYGVHGLLIVSLLSAVGWALAFLLPSKKKRGDQRT